MTASDSLLLCPHCRAVLARGQTAFSCSACGTVFPAVLGIPDLRTFDPPYSTRQQDLERARQVAARRDDLDPPGLMRFAYGTLHPEIPAADLDTFVAHRLQRAALNEERWLRLEGLFAAVQLSPPAGVALDLGCGVGGSLPLLARQMSSAVGVDIVMEELVLAHKHLAEQGIDNVTLVCADAETLPIASQTLSLVNATNVIEHVRAPGQVVSRVFDLLVPGGVFAFDSPNRWDLVYPEPHVGIRFVGLWPRFLQAPYVRLVSGKEYKGKRLLSLPELDRLLRRAVPTSTYRIFYWPRWHLDAEPGTLAGRMLIEHGSELVPLLNRIWALFVGAHEVIVWRTEDAGQQAAPRIVPMPSNTDRQDMAGTAGS